MVLSYEVGQKLGRWPDIHVSLASEVNRNGLMFVFCNKLAGVLLSSTVAQSKVPSSRETWRPGSMQDATDPTDERVPLLARAQTRYRFVNTRQLDPRSRYS